MRRETLSISENCARDNKHAAAIWWIWFGGAYALGMLGFVFWAKAPVAGWLGFEMSAVRLMIDLVALVALPLSIGKVVHMRGIARARRRTRRAFVQTHGGQRLTSYRSGADWVYTMLSEANGMVEAVPLWNADGPVESSPHDRKTADAFVPFESQAFVERA